MMDILDWSIVALTEWLYTNKVPKNDTNIRDMSKEEE